MDKLTELAMLFKRCENPNNFDISTAVVISEYPVVLKMSDAVFLSKEYENLEISATLLKDYERKFVLDGINQASNSFAATLKASENDFKIGDSLIVVPMADGEVWYALCRLGVL